MSQGDQSIANQAGAAFRADLNAELQALVTNSSGATAPGTTYPYQYWFDTTTSTLKRRNAANSAWLLVGSLSETFVVSRSSDTVLGLSDYGKTFVATGTFTQTLTAVATLGDGWHCFYRNDGSGVITLDPNASETIDGATTIALNPGEAIRIACNGSAFKTGGLLLTPPRISGAGLLDLSNAAAGQIKFPATQNASSDVNTLDDYEEGTWTPALAFGGASVGITYTSQQGGYVKIGKLVTYYGSISLSNKGSSTGSATVTGLPFSGTGSIASYGSIKWTGMTAALQSAIIESGSGTTAALYGQTAGATGSAALTDASFANSSLIQFSFTQVAA